MGRHVGGIVQLRPQIVQSFTHRDGLQSEDIKSVSEGPDGAIWLLADSELTRLDPIHGMQVRRLPARSARRCALADSTGTVWMDYGAASIPGLLGLRADGTEVHVPLGDLAQSLYEDRERRLWVGTERGVRCLRDGKELTLTNLPIHEVRSACQTRDGALWFGTKSNGVFRWRDGELTAFSTRDGLADDRVFAIHEDTDATLWIGTHNGLTRFRSAFSSGGVGPELRTFTTAHGLFDNLINHILEDAAGFLWFSCNRGLFRIARTELDAVAAGRKTPAACAVFGTADGMPSSETNGKHQPAGCRTRDGRLWFPTTHGVVAVNPNRLPRDEAPPTVVIEEVTVDGEAVAELVPPLSSQRSPKASLEPARFDLELAPGSARMMQFRYTAPTFVNAERARFQHRLRGRSDEWLDAGEERTAYFNDLKPAAYVFEVRGCNAHGVWQGTPAQFAFSLSPRFTQTVWFPTSVTMGGAVLASAFLVWRLRWQRRSLRAEQAAALAEERARIARDLHDELGTALTGVALELEVLRQSSPPATTARLGETAARTRTLAERMREVVWAVNPQCDTVPSLALFLEQQAVPFLRAAGIACRLDYPEELPRLPMSAPLRHQLSLGVREALTNVVRHSGATEVRLGLAIAGQTLTVEVVDNGQGFDPATVRTGHGLANLRERFHRMGGKFMVTSKPRLGAQVTFTVPLEAGPAFTWP